MSNTGRVDHATMKSVATLRFKEASKRAHRLFAMSSAVWAKEWAENARDDFISDLFEFASYAYDLADLIDLRDGDVDISKGGAIHLSKAPWPYETDYRRCLNAIRHATSLNFLNANAPSGRRLFVENENVMLAAVVVSTSRHRGFRVVPIFALSFAFLQHVRPRALSWIASGDVQPAKPKS